MADLPPLQLLTLGRFHVLRDGVALSPSVWTRGKARDLFQYLLTNRRRFTTRERITAVLWPELSFESAERDFKVALTALSNALQPDRPPRSLTGYLARQGVSYGLAPDAPIELDYVQFEEGAGRASQLEQTDPTLAIEWYRSALQRYQGDYLPDMLYADWTALLRERLTTLYLTSATRLAGLLLASEQHVEVVLWCQRVLVIDRCWESAYRLLMHSQLAQGNRPVAVRVYEQCRIALAEELGLEPMAATTQLYEQLLRAA